MPAISNRETIPNFALNGYELAIYVVKTFERVCEQRDLISFVREPAIAALKDALASDWVFKPTFTYPNVSCEIALQTHVIRNHDVHVAFTLEPVFKFPNNPNYPESRPFVRRPITCTAPPLDGYAPDAEHVVDCFIVAMRVENPNLIRVHCGLPITVTEKKQPAHGEMFGKIENHPVTYDPADFGPLPEPTVTEQTEQFVKAWGLEGVADVYYRAVGAHVGKLHEWGLPPVMLGFIRVVQPEIETGVALAHPRPEPFQPAEMAQETREQVPDPETVATQDAQKRAVTRPNSPDDPNHGNKELHVSTRAESGKDEAPRKPRGRPRKVK